MRERLTRESVARLNAPEGPPTFVPAIEVPEHPLTVAYERRVRNLSAEERGTGRANELAGIMVINRDSFVDAHGAARFQQMMACLQSGQPPPTTWVYICVPPGPPADAPPVAPAAVEPAASVEPCASSSWQQPVRTTNSSP